MKGRGRNMKPACWARLGSTPPPYATVPILRQSDSHMGPLFAHMHCRQPSRLMVLFAQVCDMLAGSEHHNVRVKRAAKVMCFTLPKLGQYT